MSAESPEALAAGRRPVEGLARDTAADAGTLHCVLRALASDSVLAEDESRVFRKTAPSELLRGRLASVDRRAIVRTLRRAAPGFEPVRVEDGVIGARCR